jgi:hypothetical protein
MWGVDRIFSLVWEKLASKALKKAQPEKLLNPQSRYCSLIDKQAQLQTSPDFESDVS